MTDEGRTTYEWRRRMAYLDALAARQITDPLIRFGGEDDRQRSTRLAPTSSAAINRSCRPGTQNIDRVAGYLIPGATQLGGSYARMQGYQALVQPALSRAERSDKTGRRRGGDATRQIAAGPVKPIPAERQRAAVTFLIQRGFPSPALLNRELTLRLSRGSYGRAAGSNVPLLRRLIDVGCFNAWRER